MKAMLDRSQWNPMFLIFIPSITILELSSINLKIPCKIKLFPAPVRPMIPSLAEGGKHHETKINILDEVSILFIKFVPNLRDLNNTAFSWLLPARCNEQVWVR